MHLVRDEAGAIHLRFGEPDSRAPSLGPDILDQLAGPPNPDRPFGLMRRIVVRNAAVIYDDRRTNRRWEADRVDASIERNLQGLAGDVSFALPLGNHQPELHASYRYTSDERAVDLSIQVGGVEPATLASLSPELAPLAAADLPVSGTLTTRLNLGGLTNEGVRLDLYLGKGSIRSELLPEGYVALQQGTIRAVYAPEIGELRLAKLDLDLGGGSALSVRRNHRRIDAGNDRRHGAAAFVDTRQAQDRSRRCAGGEIRELVAAGLEPRRAALGIGQRS